MGKPKASKEAHHEPKTDGPADGLKRKKPAHEAGTGPLYRLIASLVHDKRWTNAHIEKNPRSATKALNMVTRRAISDCLDLVTRVYTDIGYDAACGDAIQEAEQSYDRQLALNRKKQMQLQEWKERQKEETGGKKTSAKSKPKAQPKPKPPPRPRNPKFLDDEASASSESLDSESDSSMDSSE